MFATTPQAGPLLVGNTSDPSIEMELQMSNELPLWRGHGKVSSKAALGPCIFFAIPGIILLIIGATSRSLFRMAYLMPGIFLMTMAVVMFLLWWSASNSTWYMAVTPLRVLAIRNGGACCNPGLVTVRLAEILELSSSFAPGGYCCREGPNIKIDTVTSVQVIVHDKHGNRRAPPKALHVAIDDVSTIMAFRQAIESARSHLMGAQVIVQPMIYTAGHFMNQPQPLPYQQQHVYVPVPHQGEGQPQYHTTSGQPPPPAYGAHANGYVNPPPTAPYQ